MNTIEKQFFRTYVSIYRPLLNRLNMMISPYGISNSQFSILNLLMYNGEMTQNEIAKRQNIEKPTVTHAIKKLQDTKYIEVKPGKNDKREKWIGLTKFGESVCTDVNAQLQVLYSDLLKEVPKEDIKMAIDLLENVQRAFK